MSKPFRFRVSYRRPTLRMDLPYPRGETNGLCVALRLLGGYEGIALDV